MPKIVFWNIQRGSGKVGSSSDATDNLNIVLQSIASNHTPDIIILCEGQGSLLDNIASWNKLPIGYQVVNTNGGYKKQTTLQYAIIARSGITVLNSDLECGTGYSRPAQFLRFQIGPHGYSIAALHAASITQSQTKQMNQTNEIYKKGTELGPYHNLVAIIGDMNMDANDGYVCQSIFSKQDGDFQRDFNMKAPNEGTHSSNGGAYDKALDWAWVRNSINNPQISVIKFKGSKSATDLYMAAGDGDFMPEDDPSTKSDHLPILLSW